MLIVATFLRTNIQKKVANFQKCLVIDNNRNFEILE